MAFNRFNNGLGNLLGPTMGQGLQQVASQRLEELLAQNPQQAQTMNGLEALGFNPQEAGAMSGIPQPSLEDVMRVAQQGPQRRNQMMPGMQQESTAQQAVQNKPEVVPGAKEKKPRQPRKPKELSEKQSDRLATLEIDSKSLNAKEKKELERLRGAKTKVDLAQAQYWNKETKPLYDDLNKEYKAAVNNDKRISRIEELTKTGNLGIPLFNSAVKALSKGIFGFGLDLSGTMTTDAQELDKLSTDFIREAKAIFPGRVTDADLNHFLRIIPTLSQSNRGRLRVIHNMKLFNEGIKVKKKAMDQIIKENKGNRPYNLGELIEERSSKDLDKLADQFEKSRPNDKASSLAEAATRIGEGLLYY